MKHSYRLVVTKQGDNELINFFSVTHFDVCRLSYCEEVKRAKQSHVPKVERLLRFLPNLLAMAIVAESRSQ